MNRDGMVFRPSLGPGVQPTAPTRAREERMLERQRRGGGIFRRLAQAKLARRAVSSGMRAQAGARTMQAAKGRSLIGIGAAVTGLLVAGVAALRLATGQPLEKSGQIINDMLLGSLDEKARARQTVRNRLASDPELSRLVGQQGRINSQIQTLADSLYKQELRREEGSTMLRREFPIDNVFDMLILRAVAKLKAVWNGVGGPAAVQRLEAKYGEYLNGAYGRKGSR